VLLSYEFSYLVHVLTYSVLEVEHISNKYVGRV
jgi:hypothetical protein